MKTLSIIAIIIAALVSGCNKKNDAPDIDDPWTKHGHYSETKVIEIESHRYILLTNDRGVDIIHAESCPCHSK